MDPQARGFRPDRPGGVVNARALVRATRLVLEKMAETETKTAAPIRLERDGNVASMVLSNPPLNLFGDDAWGALVSCIDEVEKSDARALVWRADGDIFTGGVDVNSFKRVQEEGSASDSFGSLIP